MRRFDESPYSPPSIKECQQEIGTETYMALKEKRTLVALSEDVVFRRSDYESMVLIVRSELERRGQITLADVRDLFETSRKYAQALLENLDSVGLTRRVGDMRVLVGKPTGSNQP
jgi:selenocysteine-specific elongation factor